MAKDNRSQFALLGLLSLAPMSGYDIKGWIERSIGYFWSESYGQIYPQLKRLVERGYAEVRAEQGGGRQKKVYHLTDDGRQALRAWLAQPAQASPQRLEFLLKLFFCAEAPECTAAHLRQERDRAQQTLKELKAIERELTDNCEDEHALQMSLITLNYGLGLARHTVRWANASLEQLAKGRPE